LKFLITNADDFGFTRDVNEGIVHAHREGILTAATLMATGGAFDHAVTLARENPQLDIGIHLVLVGSPGYPATVSQLLKAIGLRRMPIREKLMGQVNRILETGLRPTHLDTHKHTHLLPQVLDVVARISEEFKIPWVRRPFDLPISANGISWKTRLASKSFGFVRSRFHAKLAKHHCRTTDYFAGFQITGSYDAAELAKLIRGLPQGTTEFMCHPGFCTDELRGVRTRLKESRVQELNALVSPEARKAVEESRVRLVRYRDLPASSV
jgi:chitin disaccharide deacetylase